MTSASLEGRVAVVTGAAQGIGYAVATHLTAAGAICELLDADTEAVRTAAAGLANASAWVCDVTNRQQVRGLAPPAAAEKLNGESPGPQPRNYVPHIDNRQFGPLVGVQFPKRVVSKVKVFVWPRRSHYRSSPNPKLFVL